MATSSALVELLVLTFWCVDVEYTAPPPCKRVPTVWLLMLGWTVQALSAHCTGVPIQQFTCLALHAYSGTGVLQCCGETSPCSLYPTFLLQGSLGTGVRQPVLALCCSYHLVTNPISHSYTRPSRSCFDKICAASYIYVHVLSLCHACLPFTWRIANENFQKIPFLTQFFS